VRRPPDTRSFGAVTGSQHVDAIRSLNKVCSNLEIEKEAKMTDQTDGQIPEQRIMSGIWVLVVFVALLVAVVTLVLVTQ
jgi:hypothetical protein